MNSFDMLLKALADDCGRWVKRLIVPIRRRFKRPQEVQILVI